MSHEYSAAKPSPYSDVFLVGVCVLKTSHHNGENASPLETTQMRAQFLNLLVIRGRSRQYAAQTEL